MLFMNFLNKIPNDFLINYSEYNSLLSDENFEKIKLDLNKFIYNLKIKSIKNIKIFKMKNNFYPLEYDVEQNQSGTFSHLFLGGGRHFLFR